MRILYISHLYPMRADMRFGKAIHALAEHSVSAGCQVQVISPVPWVPPVLGAFSERWRAFNLAASFEVMDGVSVYRPRFVAFPRRLFFDSLGMWVYRAISRTVEQIYRQFRFDLVHAHMAYPDGFAGMLVARDYQVPLVTTVRASDFSEGAQRSLRTRHLMGAVLRSSAAVVCPSPWLSRAVKNVFGISSSVVPNGIELADLSERKTDLKVTLPGNPILLSVGRLIETKGIDLVIYTVQRLAGRYPNLTYLIIGSGPDGKRLERLADTLGVQNRVHFLGDLPHEEVMSYMAACDVFVLPSWQETFGLVYLEAMANGKPVVACAHQGIDGIIEGGKTGILVPPKDLDALVHAVNSLLADPFGAAAIGAQGKKLVFRELTWDKSALRIKEIYERVLRLNLAERSVLET